ncbi:MAG: hypothetical protein MHM6MM_005627 [Cercozoa sp. M6MM]
MATAVAAAVLASAVGFAGVQAVRSLRQVSKDMAPHGKSWLKNTMERSRWYKGGFKETMDKSEAAMILGCRITANQAQIKQRFQVVMKHNHPDFGGSPYITSKINDARNIMIKSAEEADKVGPM